tara:strand:+ start:998 stop:1408 length:411 start_codon:yes stop_codon:yes gene_type:complete
MKNFSKYITEKASDAGYPMDGSDFSNDVANPKMVERINGFLGAMSKMEYLVPEHALNKMQEKLGRLALSFDMPDLSENGGSYSMPLTQFGGIVGEDENGEVASGDGISHRVEGGLSLEIMHEKTANGTHFIKARIV